MGTGESVDVMLPRNPSNVEKPTPQYASLVLFNSFRHSQGQTTIQKDIFSYLHTIRPGWKITQEDKTKTLETSQRMIRSFLYGNEHGRKEGITLHDSYPTQDIADTDIKNQLDEMQEKFNDEEKSDQEKKRELIQKLAKDIVDTDLYFMQRGRKRSPNNKRPLMDPWLSHIVHFGLNKNPTGVPELDEMYKDIRAFITRPGAEINQNLTEVLKIYRKKHPGVKINLKP